MNRLRTLLVTAVVAAAGVLGAWGCAQGPGNGSQGDRTRGLEAKVAALEADYREAAAKRDEARKQAAAAEKERAKLQEVVVELRGQMAKDQAVAQQERDELRKAHDAAQQRCDRLKKGLQSLLGQDEAASAAPPAAIPAVSTLGSGS